MSEIDPENSGNSEYMLLSSDVPLTSIVYLLISWHNTVYYMNMNILKKEKGSLVITCKKTKKNIKRLKTNKKCLHV